MGIKNKMQILLFPVTFTAGIVTGIAVMRTKKKAAGIAAVDAALLEELPAEENVEKDAETELSVEENVEKAAGAELPPEDGAGNSAE